MHKLILPVILLFTFHAASQNDSLLLVDFYNSLSGPEWDSTWNLNEPINIWYGVRTNEEGRVVDLSLLNNNLDGEIPPSLVNLTSLQLLSLGLDSIRGQIPQDLGNLTNLSFLQILQALLTGPIPESIGNLHEMDQIALYGNQLSGAIPAGITNLKKMRFLQLQNNQLTGPLPNNLDSLKSLESLVLSQNMLEGVIPASIGGMPNLKELQLGGNHLISPLPPSMADLDKLETLRLGGNDFNEPVPGFWSNYSQLKRLSFEFNQFSGELPILSDSIESIAADGNLLTGTISADYANKPNLRWFFLGDNCIIELPDFSSSPILEGLYVSNNNLTFSDLLPIPNALEYFYAPQKDYGVDTVITVLKGSDLSYSFELDPEVADKSYFFYRNEVEFQQNTTGILDLRDFTEQDTGEYYVRVSHPELPDLSLKSRIVRVQLDMTTSTSLHKTPTVKIYPNPARHTLRLEGNRVIKARYKVFDQRGTAYLVRSRSGTNQIDISALPQGLYYLDSGEVLIKFIKI